MASTRNPLPAQYRAKAREARDKAAAAADAATRAKLLHDADTWERMADYEDKNPTAVIPLYYPPPDEGQ